MATIPSLALIPSAYKENKVYSVLPSNGDGDFTFARASDATRVNSNGLIETVVDNIPRLDYKDGGCPSLLLEPQRTNLVGYSEDFTEWNLLNTSILENIINSPSGILNATKLIPSTTNTTHYTYFDGGIMNNDQCFSIFAKAENFSKISIETGSVSTGGGVVFDLNQGIVYSTFGNFYESSSIEEFNNGWYRCTLVTSRASANWLTVFVLDDNYNKNFQGNGSDGVYLWGGQTEQAPYPTSYIPTNGSSATRVAETCNGAGNANTFNDSEGVLFAEISALADDGTFRAITLSDGTLNNNFILYFTQITNQVRVISQSSGVRYVDSTTSVSNITNNNKIALKYKQNDFALWINGVKVLTDLSFLTPIGLNILNFDVGTGIEDFYGNTKQLQYFDTALTDLELEALTSWTSFDEMANALNYTIQ